MLGDSHIHLRPASPTGQPTHSRSNSQEGMGHFDQAFRLSPFRHSGLDAGALYSPGGGGGGESSPVAVPSPMAARATLAGRSASTLGPRVGSPPSGLSGLGPNRRSLGSPP